MDWCLVTDVDGTLIGDEQGLVALRGAMNRAREQSRQQDQLVRWVVATGRGIQSTRDVLLEHGFSLDEFDALVTSVGAEIYIDGELDEGYAQLLRDSGFSREQVHARLQHLDFLELQPEADQFEAKVSYFVADTPEYRELLTTQLAALPFATSTVFSNDMYFDVLPDNGGKGGAVEYLRQRFGLPAERVAAAGDAGNDLMMLQREWPGIVVGNAASQLDVLRTQRDVFFAQGKCAHGVLEGLIRLGFL